MPIPVTTYFMCLLRTTVNWGLLLICVFFKPIQNASICCRVPFYCTAFESQQTATVSSFSIDGPAQYISRVHSTVPVVEFCLCVCGNIPSVFRIFDYVMRYVCPSLLYLSTLTNELANCDFFTLRVFACLRWTAGCTKLQVTLSVK